VRKYTERLKGDKGAFFLDMIIGLTLLMAVILSFLALPELFIKKQEIDYMAKTIARRVEIEGELNSRVYDTIDGLAAESGFMPDIKWEGNFRGFDNRLQIREKFVLKLNHTVRIKLIDPAFSNPVFLEIPISKSVTGVSEVYWKG
jgi:hypothetical protein